MAPDALAIVSGEEVTTDDLVSHLKLTQQYHQTVLTLVRERLIERACEDWQIEASEEEVDEHVASFREDNHLYSVEETEKWLEAQQLTYTTLWCSCEKQVKLRKLKVRLAEDELEKRFAFHRLDFDGVELYRIVVRDEVQVMEILSLLKEGADFFGLAKSYSEDLSTNRQCGYLGVVRRKDLRPEVEAYVFAAREGDIAGPVKTLGDYHIYYVEKFCPAKLDGEVRELLLNEIFEEWLQRQFVAAHVDFSFSEEEEQDDEHD